MIDQIIESIRPIVVSYGALGVFLISVAEEVIAPIPSTLTMLAAGFFLIPIEASFLEAISWAFFVVALPAGLGITLGSLFLYALVYWGGKPLIDRIGRWIGVSWKDIEKMEKYFDKAWADEAILFILRATPLIPNSAISAFCGLIRYRFKTFVIITLVGTTLRAFIMGLVGWAVGEAYEDYAVLFSQIENYIWLVIILLALAIFSRYIKSRSGNKNHETPVAGD